MNADEIVSTVFGNTDDSAKAVDHVFAVLEATYGLAWDRVKGTAPIGTIKTVWAFQLGSFTHTNAAKRNILWALKNLPDAPPNAIQFRNLCRMAPMPAVPRLEAPKADPARVSEVLAKLAPLREACASSARAGHGDGRDWARKIIAKHDAGIRVNVGPLRIARQALGLEA